MTEKPDGEVTHARQENAAVTYGGPESHLYNRDVQAWVRKAANRGIYDIRGMGAKRKVPHFDDLVFLTASASRYPLEGYRERCETRTDRKSTRLNSSHANISYAVFCLKK